MEKAIEWINLYPVGSAVRFVNSYPLDSDLSVGLYTTLDPGVNSSTYPAGISAHHNDDQRFTSRNKV